MSVVNDPDFQLATKTPSVVEMIETNQTVEACERFVESFIEEEQRQAFENRPKKMVDPRNFKFTTLFKAIIVENSRHYGAPKLGW